jgi:acetolactate synthase II small subunit
VSEQQRLVIEFVPEEGALVRLLGLVERRGFRVRRAVTSDLPPGGSATLALTVEPHDAGRSLDTLILQLSRLHGVRSIIQEPPFAQDKAA